MHVRVGIWTQFARTCHILPNSRCNSIKLQAHSNNDNTLISSVFCCQIYTQIGIILWCLRHIHLITTVGRTNLRCFSKSLAKKNMQYFIRNALTFHYELLLSYKLPLRIVRYNARIHNDWRIMEEVLFLLTFNNRICAILMMYMYNGQRPRRKKNERKTFAKLKLFQKSIVVNLCNRLNCGMVTTYTYKDTPISIHLLLAT